MAESTAPPRVDSSDAAGLRLESARARLSPDGARAGIAGIALLALYAPIFPRLVEEWAAFPNLSHGFAVPFIAAYLIWTRRHHIAAIASQPSWRGLPILIAGLVAYAIGVLGGESFLCRISLPVSVAGATLLLGGWAIARQMLPGILYLFFMIPLPYMTLRSLTDSMKNLDATLAAAVLPWLGVPVFQERTFLHLANMTLEVADVCSSIPAIASLLALGGAYGFVTWRPPVIRIILLVSAVPLGIMSNLVRIIITAAGAYYVGPIALDNVIHMWNGASVFVMTMGALVLLDSALRRWWPRPAS